MSAESTSPRWCLPTTVLSGLIGFVLLVHGTWQSSATYDEVTYLRVAANWWRTGEQSEITRMGSPITFWKLQQAPVFWLVEKTRNANWLNDTVQSQPEILPWVRLGGLWIWVAGWGVTAWWARRMSGPRAMTLAGWLYALSPNLIAHGGLATMEIPLTAAFSGTCYLFWEFLTSKDRRFFIASAVIAGLAFSVKYTAFVLPPILLVAWVWEGFRNQTNPISPARSVLKMVANMVLYLVIMLLANLVLTGFATITPSEQIEHHPSLELRVGTPPPAWMTRLVETPAPQDWVGFVTQLRHQRSGGRSYLMGERKRNGWWYYYFVAMAVKIPPWFWLLVIARIGLRRRISTRGASSMPLVVIFTFLALTALGSSRNYGVRYLLPLAPLAIVWVAPIAESGVWGRRLGTLVVIGYLGSILTTHPHELTYFPAWVGGPIKGRKILADSNFDWGQGARSLVRLQHDRPELIDLTFYGFGDVNPATYGVVGTIHLVNADEIQTHMPERFETKTTFTAVSASLEFGPWGPSGYFDRLKGIRPYAMTDDLTISVYRTSDLGL